ncbi:hypothetical protein NECID01_0195 [Nematocida sp. AWRm77]|nr:hypothetical protein NECID01_0195 [Nematocida sp. AWRm77]
MQDVEEIPKVYSNMCRMHLNKRIQDHKAKLQTRIEAAQAYYAREKPETKCWCKDTACSNEIEEDTATGLEYFARVKGKLRNKWALAQELPRLLTNLEAVLPMTEVNIGFQVLAELLEREDHFQSALADEEFVGRFLQIVSCKLPAMCSTARTAAGTIGHALFKRLGDRFLVSPGWDAQTKDQVVEMMGIATPPLTKEDIEGMNRTKPTRHALQTLLCRAPEEYACFLEGFIPTVMGSRALSTLSDLLCPSSRTKLCSLLVDARALVAVYFAETVHALPPETAHAYRTTENEGVQAKYFAVLGEKTQPTLHVLELAEKWLVCNQIVQTKELQTSLGKSFGVFVKRVKRAYKQEFDDADACRETRTPEGKKAFLCFKRIAELVLAMCTGTNHNRKLQGFAYLHSIYKEQQAWVAFVPSNTVLSLVLDGLHSSYSTIKEAAGQFAVEIPNERVQRHIREENMHGVYGDALGLSRQARGERSRAHSVLLESMCTRLAETECTPTFRTHLELRVVWSLFSIDTVHRVLLDDWSVNQEVVVERGKGMAQAGRASYALSTDHFSVFSKEKEWSAERVYAEIVEPFFEKTLDFLQSKETYFSLETQKGSGESRGSGESGESGESGSPTERDFLVHWYNLRECCLFMCVYGIRSESPEYILGKLFTALLSVGAHIGVSMVVFRCIKNILVYFGRRELTLACARTVLKAVHSKGFKTVRRDGGIPYAFKAIAGSERSKKEKPVTCYILKEMIERAFALSSGLSRSLFQGQENVNVNVNVKGDVDGADVDGADVDGADVGGLCFRDFPIPVSISSVGGDGRDGGVSTKSKVEEEVLVSGLASLTVDRRAPNGPSTSAALPLDDETELIHCLNILKGVIDDRVYRCSIKEFEPYLFRLSLQLLSHTHWRVRNTAIMLFAMLIKKVCKETFNPEKTRAGLLKHRKISVHPKTSRAVLECLEAFHRQRNESGVFPCLVFFSRVLGLSSEEEAVLWGIQRAGCYGSRVHNQIRSILEPVLAETEEKSKPIINCHNDISEEYKEFLEVYQKYEEMHAAEHLSKQQVSELCRCESQLLSMLGSEDASFRKSVIKHISPGCSYESVLHGVVERTKCADCLFLLIGDSSEEERVPQAGSALQGEEEGEGEGEGKEEEPTTIFLSEAENVFRDTEYEKYLVLYYHAQSPSSPASSSPASKASKRQLAI